MPFDKDRRHINSVGIQDFPIGWIVDMDGYIFRGNRIYQCVGKENEIFEIACDERGRKHTNSYLFRWDDTFRN